jgi:crotonobetainyl-CoA:carnitine CoA-transferase CaiB-like acyl-CoA transferase
MLLKRLIKTRKNIAPYNVYQVEDGFIACLNDVVLFKTKHQHLATSECLIRLAEQRNKIREANIRDMEARKASGII